jgi:hypothetical protein
MTDKRPSDDTDIDTVDMDEAEALAVTADIRMHVEAAWELIVEAYNRRAWVALCYSSWDAYCIGEFGNARLRLPREDRSELVCSLRHAGLSIRAIASATGHSKDTIRKDLYQTGTPELAADEVSQTGTPEPATVTGRDGKTYPTKPKPKLKPDVPKPKPDVPAPAPEDAGLNWDSIPGNQREKVRAAVSREASRQVKKWRRDADEQLKAMEAKYFADTMKATREARDQLRRDREALNKGFWTPDEYKAIRKCLHPDRVGADGTQENISPDDLKRAFQIFTDERVKALLVKGAEAGKAKP